MFRKIFLIFIFFLIPLNVFASDAVLELKPEMINPGHSLYTFKRAIEKVQEKLLFNQEKKINFEARLLEKRVSELNFLVNKKKLTPIERASQRLSAQSGVYVQELERAKSNNIEGVLTKFNDYRNLLGILRDNFPANSAYWLLIQQNIDTLNVLAEKIND